MTLISCLQFRRVIDVNKKGLFKYNSSQEYADLAFPSLNAKMISDDDVSKITKEWFKPVAEGVYQMCRPKKALSAQWNKWRKSLISEFENFDRTSVPNFES